MEYSELIKEWSPKDKCFYLNLRSREKRSLTSSYFDAGIPADKPHERVKYLVEKLDLSEDGLNELVEMDEMYLGEDLDHIGEKASALLKLERMVLFKF